MLIRSHTVRYEPVRTRRSYKGRCPVCGKPVTRNRSFEQTVSPFNRNPDGTVRTVMEVNAAVNAEADKWKPDFRHAKCIKEES